MYDVIVVGARCAGSPTAMLLARLGYRVLLLDRATFPSDAPRCHFIQPPGIARLHRWGLLDAIRASNCPHIPFLRFDIGPFALVSPPAEEAQTGSYGPRRSVLDTLLIEAAARAGAEVREGVVVQEILIEGDRVTGIRGYGPGRAEVREQARLVVGADGLHSLVARTVEAASYHVRPARTCVYFAYWREVPVEACEVYVRERRTFFAFPTNNTLTCIAIECPIEEFHAFRANLEESFRETLALAPDLACRVQRGRREGAFLGSGDLPNFYRKPYGPGWALVGDAGYHKDPYLAQGISDAFRDAELLAEAVDLGLSGRRDLAAALAGYERQRNEETLALYELNYEFASLERPSPQMQRLFCALRDNPTATRRFFAVLGGTLPVREFFAPAHLERVMASRG